MERLVQVRGEVWGHTRGVMHAKLEVLDCLAFDQLDESLGYGMIIEHYIPWTLGFVKLNV